MTRTETVRNARPVRLIGVPMDLGAGRRGVDMGPSAVRYAGIGARIAGLGHEYHDGGDISVPIPEARAPGKGPRYLREIHRACERLAQRVERLLDEGVMPLVVGGDHSMAIGTVTGVAAHHRKRDERIGLVWVDAHADMNTPETSPTGNVHGMPLACVLGKGPEEMIKLGASIPMVDPARAVLIGIRSVDPGERELVRTSGIQVYSMREIDMLGMDRVMREAIDIVTKGTAGFHLTFDMDGCDPAAAPGVGTPVSGGVTHREAHLLLEHAAESKKLLGLELTEINPILDHRNMTAELAVEFVLSGLGKRIV
jgi:arginase